MSGNNSSHLTPRKLTTVMSDDFNFELPEEYHLMLDGRWEDYQAAAFSCVFIKNPY
ncbi:hypothetical protein SLEP1_g44256 [Rubroshorea leprosula]|uniref:Uncharacterized protein n=1 Tax=Rubroshorea leprosula TaxID=152421 RepID=A0AAV5LHG8_9ROSI|nr:hypothetical protein SLEP1_g44256 [Rubroshorea leprosula]